MTRVCKYRPEPNTLRQLIHGVVLVCCAVFGAGQLQAQTTAPISQSPIQPLTQSSTQPAHHPSTRPATAALGPDGLPFARLFNTPDQRHYWDRNRAGQHKPGATTAADVQTPKATAAGKATRLSGVILRADGEQILWVNGQMQRQTAKSPRHAVFGQQSDALRVQIASRQLKPGQVWLSGNRKVQEAYQVAQPRPVIAAPAEPMLQPSLQTKRAGELIGEKSVEKGSDSAVEQNRDKASPTPAPAHEEQPPER